MRKKRVLLKIQITVSLYQASDAELINSSKIIIKIFPPEILQSIFFSLSGSNSWNLHRSDRTFSKVDYSHP